MPVFPVASALSAGGLFAFDTGPDAVVAPADSAQTQKTNNSSSFFVLSSSGLLSEPENLKSQ